MRTKLRSKVTLLFMTCALLIAVPAVAAIADIFNADADLFATQVTGGGPGSGTSNDLSATQDPGTTRSYPLSAAIRETGNTDDDVFAASGDKVTVTNTFGGDWLSPVNVAPSFPPTFEINAYDQNAVGAISITVPCNAAANTSKTMTVNLGASASNGKSLNGDPQTLNYIITASGTPDASCTPANSAPVLGAIGNKSGNEGSLLSFTASATDPGDTVTYSLAHGTTNCGSVTSCTVPSGASIGGSSGAFSWTPGYDAAGTYKLTVKMTDNGSPVLSDEEQITITVANTNRPPTVGDITAANNDPVNEGDSRNY